MNILIVSATNKEFSRTALHFHNNKNEISFLQTGVGIMHSCFSLTNKLQTSNFDLVIQAGICGSVSKSYNLGDIIHITEDEIIDVGSTSNSDFIPLTNLKFSSTSSQIQEIKFSPDKSVITNLLEKTTKGKGITSNTAHGDSFWVNLLHKNHPLSFESMEGACSFFVCNNFKIPVLQIRSISNYIEIRDTSKWEIKKSIDNLNQYLIELINEIQTSSSNIFVS